MSQADRFKEDAWVFIDSGTPEFSDFHLTIWDYAETAWHDYRSAHAYVEFLRMEG